MICPNLERIFVHVPKCAGSSMEQALFRAEEETEPVTRNTPAAERFLVYGRGDNQHFPLSRIREVRPESRDWPALALVRDPYERVVSEYYYQGKFRNKTVKGRRLEDETLNEAIRSGSIWDRAFRWHSKPASEFIDGSCYVVKVEELEEETPRIASFLGLSSIKIPKANRTVDRPVAKELLDVHSREIILTIFADDFDRWGYAK